MTKARQQDKGRGALNGAAAHDIAGEPTKHHQRGARNVGKKCYIGTMIKRRKAVSDSEMLTTHKTCSKLAPNHSLKANATMHKGPFCACEQWSTKSGNTIYRKRKQAIQAQLYSMGSTTG